MLAQCDWCKVAAIVVVAATLGTATVTFRSATATVAFGTATVTFRSATATVAFGTATVTFRSATATVAFGTATVTFRSATATVAFGTATVSYLYTGLLVFTLSAKRALKVTFRYEIYRRLALHVYAFYLYWLPKIM
jgi:hypothetical protein